MTMPRCRAVVIAALAVAIAIPSNAQRPAPSDRLSACLAAADKAEDYDPTNFECDWKSVTSNSLTASLTGRYIYQHRGITGGMTILEGADPALVALNTVTTRTANSCTLQLEGKREPSGELVVVSITNKTCVVRIRATARNMIGVTSSGCSEACGLDATFDGAYRAVGK